MKGFHLTFGNSSTRTHLDSWKQLLGSPFPTIFSMITCGNAAETLLCCRYEYQTNHNLDPRMSTACLQYPQIFSHWSFPDHRAFAAFQKPPPSRAAASRRAWTRGWKVAALLVEPRLPLVGGFAVGTNGKKWVHLDRLPTNVQVGKQWLLPAVSLSQVAFERWPSTERGFWTFCKAVSAWCCFKGFVQTEVQTSALGADRLGHDGSTFRSKVEPSRWMGWKKQCDRSSVSKVLNESDMFQQFQLTDQSDK